jgi:protoporphyrinogen oxidase
MNSRIAVFGAGMTGLATARALASAGHEVHVYEATAHAGGLARGFQDDDGYVYDHGPHFIFSTLAQELGLQHVCEPVRYYEDVHIEGRRHLFPFGLARRPAFAASVALAAITRPFRARPQHLQAFLETYYGPRFARAVPLPLIEKWSGTAGADLSTDLAHRLLPTDLAYLAYSLLKRLRGGITEDYYRGGRYIVYPRGGMASLFAALVSSPGVTLHLDAPLEALELQGDRITRAIVGGTAVEADAYVSTVPLDRLGAMVAERSWTSLRYRGLRLLFLKVRRPRVLEHLWTWFPEGRFPFYRITEYRNAMRAAAPPGRTVLSLELSIGPATVGTVSLTAALAQVEAHLHALYGLTPAEIDQATMTESAAAYPLLRCATEAEQRRLEHRTRWRNLFLAGRTGMLQYVMLEGCLRSALSCAAVVIAVLGGEQPPPRAATVTDRYGRPDVVPE